MEEAAEVVVVQTGMLMVEVNGEMTHVLLLKE